MSDLTPVGSPHDFSAVVEAAPLEMQPGTVEPTVDDGRLGGVDARDITDVDHIRGRGRRGGDQQQQGE